MQENPISRRTALLGVAALAAAATPGFSQQPPGRKQKDSQLPPGGASPIFTLREGASRQFTTFDPATRQKAWNKASRLAFTLPAKDKLVDWYRIRDTDHQSIP